MLKIKRGIPRCNLSNAMRIKNVLERPEAVLLHRRNNLFQLSCNKGIRGLLE